MRRMYARILWAGVFFVHLAGSGCSARPTVSSELGPITRGEVARREVQRRPEQEEVNPALIRALISGETAIEAHVDPTRGVIFMEYSAAMEFDERADADGMIRRARRECGGGLTLALGALRAELEEKATYHAQDRGDEPQFVCEGLVCRFNGQMEYDLGGELRFEQTEVYGTVLVSVLRHETQLVTEALISAARGWSHSAKVSPGPCF